jgi:peptide/nickel transport system permease protein
MTRYIVKRLLLGGVTLFAILLVSYVLLRLAPGDPARSNLFASDGGAMEQSSEKGAFAGNRAIREKLFLDKPVLVGFLYWFGGIVRSGDFGSSAVVDPGKPTWKLIVERLPVTLTLNLWAIAITYFFAVFIGVYAAVYADSWFDQSTAALLFFLYSLPVMWVGLLLQSALCDGGIWPVFPLKGLTAPDHPEFSTWAYLAATAKCYVLPVFCLAYGGLAGLSRYARNGMLEVIHCDFIRTARAKGVPETAVIWRHAFRNALITLITLFGGLLPSLVAGSVLVEYVFNIPGMGALSLIALSSRDYPLVMTLFAFGGALTLGGILLADLLYVLADPRISLSGRRD